MVDATTVLTWDNGILVDTESEVFWEPAVVAPPVTVAQPTKMLSVSAYDSVTIPTGGSEVVLENLRTVSAPALRHRILVNNKDVTYLRDVETPELTFSQSEPLLHDAGRIVFPQFHAAFETAGEGDWGFLVRFATVVQQRVATDGTVVATDYIGFISDFDHDGAQFACTLGGQAIGRAATKYKPPPIFPRLTDIGFQGLNAVNSLQLPIADPPDTGIETMPSGGGFVLDFLQTLCAQSTMLGGAQWTIMPNADGKYEMIRKDTTTIHATVYFDDADTVPSLRRDFTEEVSQVYVTATNTNGFLLDFAVYPGLTSAARSPYPMAGDAAMPPGTADADTSTGAGVTALTWKLQVMGYLDADDRSSTWTTDPDDPITEAVTGLQKEAGLLALWHGTSTAGTVDLATWNSLYDTDDTGFSRRKARIHPAASLDYAHPWLRTASGQIIRRNPLYRPDIPVVDAPLDMGANIRRRQARKWANKKLAETNASNWVGDITCNTEAVIRGEHNPGDPLTADDVMDARELRPGMNVWAPLFDGGTLLHISGRSGNVLTVDTQARDHMEVAQIIKRNRESRRNPERQWRRENLSSKLTRDAMTGANELFGWVDDRRDCSGGEWTVFPVLGAQEGIVQSIHIRTGSSQTVYALAVFGKRIWPSTLRKLVPDPLGDLGSQAWQNNADALVNDHWLLAQWGDKEQPCGYYPHNIDPSSETIPDVTGEFFDQGGFPYFAVDRISLWIAFFPIDDTHILPGRLLRAQLYDASA